MSEPVGTVHLNITSDIDQFQTKLRGQLKGISDHLGRQFADTFSKSFASNLTPAMTAAVREATRTAERGAPKINVDVDADVRGATTAIRSLERLSPQVTANVDADTATASGEIRALGRLSPHVEVNVDADTGAARANISDLASEAAKSTDRINGLVLAGAAIGPVLVPAIAAAAAGMVALSTAAGSAIAAVGVGALAFHGIGDAVSALGAASTDTSKAVAAAGQSTYRAAQQAATAASRQDALAGALDRVKQAQAGLTNTIASTASANRRAVDQVTSAERALATAQRDAKAVQQDLTAARRDAALALAELHDREREGLLSEKEANLALREAKEAQRKADADPKSTELDRERAALNVERATLQLEEQTKANKDLATQRKAADKAGVSGSQQVLDAQQRIRDSQTKVTDAEKDLAQARRDQAETARRGAASIAQAQQAIVAAQRSVVASQRQVNLGFAPLTSTPKAIDKVAEAMSKLSPAGRDFARYIFGLKDDFKQLKVAAETGFLPNLTKAIELLRPFLPRVKDLIAVVATAMGNVAIKIAEALKGPEFSRLLKYMTESAPRVLSQLGSIGISLGRIFANIFVAAGPAGEKLLADFGAFLTKVADFTSSKRGQSALADFFNSAVPVLESVGRLVLSVVNLFGAVLGTGQTQSFQGLMDSITAAINGLATVIRENPHAGEVIKGIALALLGFKLLGTTAKIIAGVTDAFTLLGATLGRYLFAPLIRGIGFALRFAFGGPIGLAITALVLLVGALIYAYTHSETFKRTVDTALRAVGKTFTWLWDKAVKPAITAIGKVLVWLYNNIVKPYLRYVRVAIDILWAAAQVTFGLLQIGLKALGAVFKWLYTKVVKPVMGWIGDKISTIWTKVIKPVFNVLASYIKKHVAPKFQSAVSALGKIWDGLQDAAKKPISFIIDTVLNNGLLKAYNTVAKKFHVKPDNVHVDNPFATKSNYSQPQGIGRGALMRARGGPISGPGSGTSDDIPIWASNGEFMLRAKAVQKLGVPFLNILNHADKYDLAGDPSGAVLGRPAFANGGLIQKVQGWLPSVDPKPYIWGGVGPGGFDCSGLVGEVMARLTGRPSFHRYMTTSSDFRAMGWRPGRGTFTMGVNPGVHMAGNLGGLPFEAASTRSGIHIGGSARSVSKFAQQWYLPQIGDKFVGGGSSGGGGGINLPNFGDLAGAAWRAGLNPLLKRLVNRIPGGGLMKDLGVGAVKSIARNVLKFDSGGLLPPGTSVVRNETGRPEPVFTGGQFDRMLDPQSRAAAKRGDTYITVERTEDQRLARQIRREQENLNLLTALTQPAF